MALIDLVGERSLAAAIVGETLLAREFLDFPVERILDGLLDQSATRPPQRTCKILFDRLEARPFHNPSDFAIAREIESSWDGIRSELKAACYQGPFSAYRQAGSNFTDPNHWSTVNLLLPSGRLAPHASLCPKTTTMLQASGVFCEAAMISRLAPGGHILPHCGPWNARLVAHVGITAPEAAEMRVASESRHWTEGRAMIFDDSFEHECWNNAEADRFVLLFAIWHPGWLEHELVLLKNIERHMARIYWDSEEDGFLKRFDHLIEIENSQHQCAFWPASVSAPPWLGTGTLIANLAKIENFQFEGESMTICPPSEIRTFSALIVASRRRILLSCSASNSTLKELVLLIDNDLSAVPRKNRLIFKFASTLKPTESRSASDELSSGWKKSASNIRRGASPSCQTSCSKLSSNTTV